jgi:hypothetical protein
MDFIYLVICYINIPRDNVNIIKHNTERTAENKNDLQISRNYANTEVSKDLW